MRIRNTTNEFYVCARKGVGVETALGPNGSNTMVPVSLSAFAVERQGRNRNTLKRALPMQARCSANYERKPAEACTTNASPPKRAGGVSGVDETASRARICPVSADEGRGCLGWRASQ